MYQIKVRHNYLYKLLEELPFFLPDAKYRIQDDDTIVTANPQMVEIANYVFQFQPDLLIVEYFLPTGQRKAQIGIFEANLLQQPVVNLA